MPKLGSLLMALEGLLPDWITVLASNSIFILSWIKFYEGIRQFRGRSARPIITITIFSLFLVSVIYYSCFSPDHAARIAIFSVCLGVLFGRCAAEFIYRAPKKYQRTYSFTGAMFIIGSLALFARAALSYQMIDSQS